MQGLSTFEVSKGKDRRMLRIKLQKTLLFSILGMFLGWHTASAQVFMPVEWDVKVEQNGAEADLIFKAKIDPHWHVYVQDLPKDEGPIPTTFTFETTEGYERDGAVAEEGAKITEHDPNFDMDLSWYENEVTFRQKIKVTSASDFQLVGYFEFMVCDDERCLPPEFVDFTFDIEGVPGSTGDVGPPAGGGESEIFTPVVWTFSSEKTGEGEYDIVALATIDEGWHVYSQHLESDEGPIPTTMLVTSDHVELVGEVTEPEAHVEYDPNFEMNLSYFSNSVEFRQKIKVTDATTNIEGYVDFMTCNDERCLPPSAIDFEIDLATGKGWNPLEEGDVDAANLVDAESLFPKDLDKVLAGSEGDCGEEVVIDSAWSVFLLGFLGGLFALLTPCVFPMIPLTVSFFTKGDQERGKGLGRAALYGFFIFFIYAALSIPFHFGAESDVLNQISTSIWLNLIFFAVFLVFAFSFFGYFEITMPAKLTNKADNAANVGGVIGIFFMALTLALVSFSCTGPILGAVLGNSLSDGPWPITAAFSGFGIALGLPFALFAAFPSLMNKLPSSGGWLNSVKVVLGFVELALALKFLSNADLVKQWGLVHRETFFLVWVLLGVGLTAYLFGLIKFPHDSPIKKLKPGRIGFAMLILAFTVYLVPGVLKNSWWNHSILSGFPPPAFYSWYDKETFHSEFDDFDLAWAEAQATGKPLFVDYTGWACVNCRKMEETVWTVDTIQKLLGEEFILVSLYVDDKNDLPEDQYGKVFEYTYEDPETGEDVEMKRKFRSIGDKWAAMQTRYFGNNSQPYYVMLSPDGDLLGTPVGYTPDEVEYQEYIECGLNTYRRLNETAEWVPRSSE